LGKVAETVEDYRKVYQHTWSRGNFRRMLYNLPVYMTLDDHEVDDDWRWLNAARTRPYIPWWDRFIRWLDGRKRSELTLTAQRVKSALKAYWEHQGMHAPDFLKDPIYDQSGMYQLPEDEPGSLAYTFEYGPAAFFVMDTRSMRVRPLLGGEKTMLGKGQWEQLEAWLLQVKDDYAIKFLVSSCSLLFYSWLDIPQDRWSGYASERDRLLKFIATNGIQGVYVLSGDFHFGFAIDAELNRPEGGSLSIWEFCSSPFEQSHSKWAARTRLNIHNGLFKRQECVFKALENNFGVVRVLADENTSPRVYFCLFDADGDLLNQTSG
jgi:alkaline phosphatase D